MSEVDYIGANELVFNTDKEAGIYSGGFSINSIMMKSRLSPIITVNKPLQSGGSSQVSDLFKDLVIPNWALSYSMNGGEYRDESSDSEGEIDDDLHDKLLGLVREHDIKTAGTKNNKASGKPFGKTRRRSSVRKTTTRKKRLL